jgi:hypothetical protein
MQGFTECRGVCGVSFLTLGMEKTGLKRRDPKAAWLKQTRQTPQTPQRKDCGLSDETELWTVVVVPLKGFDGPAFGRFKKWLKAGKRWYGLECVDLRYATDQEKAAADARRNDNKDD